MGSKVTFLPQRTENQTWNSITPKIFRQDRHTSAPDKQIRPSPSSFGEKKNKNRSSSLNHDYVLGDVEAFFPFVLITTKQVGGLLFSKRHS